MSRLAKTNPNQICHRLQTLGLRQFLCRKERCWASLDKYRTRRRGAIAFWFIHDWFNLPRKMIDSLYLANKCEAMLSTKRLKICKCTQIKCYLETNLASRAKQTNVAIFKTPCSFISVMIFFIYIYIFFACRDFSFLKTFPLLRVFGIFMRCIEQSPRLKI